MAEQKRYDLFVSYALADCAWVEGYLFDALDRAGIQYCSEAAFALGVPRLLEFERAIRESRRVLLVVSPAYVGDNFEQFTDLLAQSYGLETSTWPVIPLILGPVKLPPHLGVLTSLDASNPADWAGVVERLCATLNYPAPDTLAHPACPYPGMSPFDESASACFFGRSNEVQEMVERLRLHPFLAVIGPSGCGKSSLVFAGLIPALRKSSLFGAGEWVIQTVRPGEQPLDTLVKALRALASTIAVEPSTTPPETAERALKALVDAGKRLLLIVDQFEEVFTVAQRDSVPFQQTLLDMVSVAGCYVVLTVRADFYAELMNSPLWQQIRAHRLELAPLDAAGLHQAILRPAESVDVYIEASLVERLVADADNEPGILPLIQETLVLLWDRLERRYLPLKAYETLVLPRSAYGAGHGGAHPGLQVALARRASTTLASLSPEQQAIARRIFVRLVQFGEGRADTRRQQPVAALRSARDNPACFEQTLQHLANCRLITLSGVEGSADRQADIAHEALIAGWPQLQDWLDKRHEAEQVRRRLEAKAAEWSRLGQSTSGLLDEIELHEAERWLASPDAEDLGYEHNLPGLVEASRRAIEAAIREKEELRQRELSQAQALATEQARRAEEQAVAARRLRARFTVAAACAVLALAAAVAAVYGFWRAENQARLALARQLAAQAIAHLEDQLDLALLLSLEANRVADVVEARGSLLSALTASPHITTYLRGHAGRTRSLSFSPNGLILASGGGNGRILLWDVMSHQQLGPSLQGHTGEVKSVAFSPDGATLVSGGADGTVVFWDVALRRQLGSPLVTGHGEVQRVVFSPDGGLLASGQGDGSVILWDTATRQPHSRPLVGHTSAVISVAFSPDGRVLASGSADKTIMLWDVATGRALGEPLEGHTDWVVGVAFSPDGHTLASGAWDRRIILWDVAKRQPIGSPLTGHANFIECLGFSPDGKTLASGSADNTVILWDVATHQQAGRPLLGHASAVWSLAFSPDGHTLASGGGDGATILWDLGSQSISTRLTGHTNWVWSVAFSPDSRTLASGSADHMVRLWDVAAGAPIGEPLAGHAGTVGSVAFSPDGKLLASSSCRKLEGTACRQGEIRLWDTRTRQPIGEPLIRQTDWVRAVAFSPDGKLLASGSGDKSIVLWDVATRQPIEPPLNGHSARVESLAFSPDGRMLASGGADNTIILWDTTTHTALGRPLARHANWVESVAFSPDGRTLASGGADNAIYLWDVSSRQAAKPVEPALIRHTNWVQGVAFSPDGRMLASGGADGSIILWDTSTRRQVGPQLSGPASVMSVAFSPDGKRLAAGSVDGTISLLDVNIESWQRRACVIANRNFGQPDEWRQYLGDEPYHRTCQNLPTNANQ